MPLQVLNIGLGPINKYSLDLLIVIQETFSLVAFSLPRITLLQLFYVIKVNYLLKFFSHRNFFGDLVTQRIL